MKRHLLILLAFLMVPLCVGTTQDKKDSPLPASKDATIRFPSAPITPQPVTPPPLPPAVYKLGVEQLYVVDGDVPFFLLEAPLGLVKITEDAGPLRVRGKFVDGDGKVETRTYKGKHVYLIEAAKTGTLTLFAVPSGVTSQRDVITKTVEVEAGEGPRPPPGPIPPTPTPDDKAPIPHEGFRVLIVEDKLKLSTLPEDQLAIRTAGVVQDFLNAKCAQETLPNGKKQAGWRIWDKRETGAGDLKLWADAMKRPRAFNTTGPDGKHLVVNDYWPWIVVSNGKTGYEGPLPANIDKTMELLRKYAP